MKDEIDNVVVEHLIDDSTRTVGDVYPTEKLLSPHMREKVRSAMTNINESGKEQFQASTQFYKKGDVMTDDVTKRINAIKDKIKPIPKGGRRRALRRLGSLFWEMLEFSNMELVSLLHVVNRERCSPPLPDWIPAVLAGGIIKEAKQNFGRMWSGIVCLDNIPADEVDAMMKMIEALPYACSSRFSSVDVRSSFWQEELAYMQSELIDYDIDEICNDAESISKLKESLASLQAALRRLMSASRAAVPIDK